MEEILIKAEKRKGMGKSVAKKLRKQGSIPAVLYGRDTEPVPIIISARDWEKLKKRLRRNAILKMELHHNGSVENRQVMVKDIQRGFPDDDILHIDFLQVSMERMIEVEIPIHLTGEPKGVKVGGILDQHLRTVRVECLPTQIPEKIDVDVSELEIGDSFHVNQLSMPGVKILESVNVAIVTVIPPTVEEEKPAAAAEVVEEAEVEKVEEEKKEE